MVVSKADLSAEQGRVWLAMVTSAPGSLQRGDALVTDPAGAGLARACRVRGAELATLDTSLIVARTGALTQQDREAVRVALAACAGW